MTKKITLLVMMLILVSCQQITEVVSSDDQVGSFIVGNVELKFDFDTILGKVIYWLNGNDRAIGIYITDNKDEGKIILSDSWTGSLKPDINRAVFSANQEIKVTIIIYKDVNSIIKSFIQSLSGNFLENIQESWIEKKIETVIKLS